IQVASYEHYDDLYKEGNGIENGFGVLYGDESTETQSEEGKAYGYRYDRSDKKRGMRGVFVYNSQNAKYIFFPIGASGYGHRKAKDGKGTAVLRYAANNRTGNFPYSDKAPLFWDLYRRPGAVYWLRQQRNNSLAWDFNYFTFDFSSLGVGNIWGDGPDACFIRCVKTN
ncbi:MAG: hypothetical protein K2I90_03020, partial [Odoribacter sp.]|nr:hypothetical protein [Odoribacter sp.]